MFRRFISTAANSATIRDALEFTKNGQHNQAFSLLNGTAINQWTLQRTDLPACKSLMWSMSKVRHPECVPALSKVLRLCESLVPTLNDLKLNYNYIRGLLRNDKINDALAVIPKLEKNIGSNVHLNRIVYLHLIHAYSQWKLLIVSSVHVI